MLKPPRYYNNNNPLWPIKKYSQSTSDRLRLFKKNLNIIIDLTDNAFGTLKSSSMVEGHQGFHLHINGFELVLFGYPIFRQNSKYE